MEKRVSDLEGDSSLVLVEGNAAERFLVEGIVVEEFLVDRVPVERVVLEGVAERIAFEWVPSCHPVHEHQKGSACHLGVDPSQPLDER